MACQGMRRRSAASASRERVKAFSFARSCWRGGSHSCGETICGVIIARCSLPFSLALCLLVAILFLLNFLMLAEIIRAEKFSELGDAHRQNSSRRSCAGGHRCCTCDTCWTHICLL